MFFKRIQNFKSFWLLVSKKYSEVRFVKPPLPYKNVIEMHFYTHFHWKKGIVTLVIRGSSMKNTQDRYRHVYIDQEAKTKLFSQCPMHEVFFV